ncbi:MAG: acireductone synthase [Alphaproteobacteria bacterium]|nr:acireductone synthase [Alphaproteobacteria bacterium]MCB1839914.1 acireductone synthase [Alphaproteobacteria bacterium]
MAKSNIKAVLTDIEGTTSSISFVKDVLFPYAYKHLPEFVEEYSEEITQILDDVRTEEKNPGLTQEEVVEVLQRWIEEDQKLTPLKTLQGMIWQAGYEAGELHGHIYDDAVEGLKRWKKSGLKLYIYSSGSIAAQKLLFSNTAAGDLTTLFAGYFDTTTGPKMQPESYEKISREIGLPASEILFLSDNIQEIEAADKAGMMVLILDRDGVLEDPRKYRVAKNFDDIAPDKIAA